MPTTSERGCRPCQLNSRISRKEKAITAFREYLQKIYADGPEAVGDFVSNSFVFVRIRQRFWRGYRKANDVEVAVDGLKMDTEKGAMTQPSWKLAPADLVEEFQLFSTSVNQAIDRHAFSPKENPDAVDTCAGAASAVLVGGGRHMVDTAVWPQMQQFLNSVAARWSEAADRWCTEDGHAKLHAHVEEQYGKEIYEKIAGLIPDRNDLRARFGLDVRTAPVRIVEDKSPDASIRSGRREEVLDLLELAVRLPREEAASAWEAVGARLVDLSGEEAVAVKQVKIRDGVEKVVNRSILEKTVRSVRNHTLALSRAERYLDPTLRQLRDRILNEFPADAAAAKTVAKTLAEDDAEAIRIGLLLVGASEVARNERMMCEGLEAAMGAAN